MADEIKTERDPEGEKAEEDAEENPDDPGIEVREVSAEDAGVQNGKESKTKEFKRRGESGRPRF